jgi:diketogulonate reductase-like aldo/keto reductase
MTSFQPAPDGVDPAAVPTLQLSDGGRLPAIGLGTFGSDQYGPERVAEAVTGAAEVGYRHFDCAAVYRNEAQIGAALRGLSARGLKRDALWLTSKVWNDSHDRVVESCARSLEDLGVDYLDLYLVHWPFPNHHAPGVDVNSRDPHAVPYVHERYMRTWRQMEELVRRGWVRRIGTSNMTIPKLRLVLRDAEIKPAVNEMELHPHFQQPELFDFVVANGLTPIGYSPLGSPARPERDRTPEDTADLEDPVIVSIAERLGLHPALISLKWAVQRGQVPIPFSVKRPQYLANLRAVAGPQLTADAMAAIAGIDRGCRLIKGQVFLWNGARGWQDLWDPEGEIAR